VHALWEDLLKQISNIDSLGLAVAAMELVLEERLTRMAISVYGYMKRVAAIKCVQQGKEQVRLTDAFETMKDRILRLHQLLSWEIDVKKRTKEIRLGKW